MIEVSVTLTTCGRIDLLEQTIKSFEENNTYPINEFLIICDDPSQHMMVKSLIENKNYIGIYNEQNIGQKKSLDILFSACKNEYIFHLEDDWIFDNNSKFIENSIKILERDKNIHQVWVRHENDNPHGVVGELITLDDDTSYKLVDPNFREQWNGYSWNPGLRRKSDYLNMFPTGLNHYRDESDCCRQTNKFAYRSALLYPTVCYHNGYGRTTQI